MKKQAELFFAFLKIPVDYLMLIIAGFISYAFRFGKPVQDIRPVLFTLPLEQFIALVLIISAIWLIFFAWAGLYSFQRRKITEEMARVILACSTGMTAIIIYMFFVRQMFSSRFIVLAGWIISMILIVIARLIIRKIQNTSLKHGWGCHNVIIIGDDKNTEEIIKTFQEQPWLGYKIIGHAKTIDENTKMQLLKLKETRGLDEIIQTDPSMSRHLSVELIDFANEHNLIFKYAAGQFEARTRNFEVHMIAGVPLVEIKKTKLDGWGKIIKRILDIIISTILIIILSPFMLIFAILIKLEDKGPAIYKNERVNSKGIFNVYKFRSMYRKFCIGRQFEKCNSDGAEVYEQNLIKTQSLRQGPVYKILNDPRRTKVGRFLEKTSIDELPQLFNVWIGNMSLVGPRPHQPREVEKYQKEHRHVLDIKPGMTGLAQISGRSDLDFDEEVKLDAYYIENWSLGLDVWILLKTPWVVIRRKSKV